MTDPIGVAFVGAGTVAEMHGRAVSAIPNARLIGAFDLDPAKAQAITARFGGRVFSSFDQLLSDPEIDALHILTPVEHHVPHAVAALRAGKHVLVEKPVAASHEELQQLKQAASAAGRVCMPAYNYIYAPSIRRAKRLIQSGKLGKVASLWILYNIFHSQQTAAIYGGVLRAICTHHAYSVLYLLGRPHRLTAIASRIQPNSSNSETFEDQALVVCQMDDGAIANLWSSFAANDPTNDPWTVLYKVLGTNGGVSYSWNEAQFTDDGGPAWGMPCYEETFVEEIDHFINHCIQNGEPPLSTLDDAADAFSILLAAEQAIRRQDSSQAINYDNRP
jgi:predicted dehydrogenase